MKALPLMVAAGVLAAVDYPTIPKDLTTPVQQRLAINGPNGMPNVLNQVDSIG